MDTNFFGALRCMKAVLPRMRKNKSGHIINITSIAGIIASSPDGAYCASTFALEALSEKLAQEVRAYNIKVNIVEPGILQTPILDNVATQEGNTSYPPTIRRMKRLFDASLKNPVSPNIVGEKILEIIHEKKSQLRHSVGPDADPFIQWRNSLTDQQFESFGTLSDEELDSYVRTHFSLVV